MGGSDGTGMPSPTTLRLLILLYASAMAAHHEEQCAGGGAPTLLPTPPPAPDVSKQNGRPAQLTRTLSLNRQQLNRRPSQLTTTPRRDGCAGLGRRAAAAAGAPCELAAAAHQPWAMRPVTDDRGQSSLVASGVCVRSTTQAERVCNCCAPYKAAVSWTATI
jgi:hypothetical protein